MDYLFQDGGKSKKTKSKTKTTKTTKSKSSTKTGSKTTKSKTTTKKSSSKKGGNFLGTVGELVAPSGWETFATTAGLFALDRADAALRRSKKTKSSVKKGGMRGGYSMEQLEAIKSTIQQILNDSNSPSENTKRLLVNIRGYYSDFLNTYKIFLQTEKPKNGSSKEIKDNYIKDMWSKLQTMIGNLNNIIGVIKGRNSNRNGIPVDIFTRLSNLTLEIDRIIKFLVPQRNEYLSKLPK
jgi:hypothetical protein